MINSKIYCDWSMLSLIMIKFNYVFIQPAPEVQVITPRITQHDIFLLVYVDEKLVGRKRMNNINFIFTFMV